MQPENHDETVTVSRGPFSTRWHEHAFVERDGMTHVTDSVRFRSPAGPLGPAVDRLVLTRYMTRLLEQRTAWLKTELERG